MEIRNATTNNEAAKARLAELSDAMRTIDESKKPLQDEFNSLHRAVSDTVKRRISAINRGELAGKFAPQELIFAAAARCDCGAGIAYPDGIGIGGFWDCSAILLGRADASVKHCGQLPFAFYEIKSEQQPSAGGATTRPR